MVLSQVTELGVGADAQGLGVGAHGVHLAVRVELGAAHRLHVLQGRDRDELGPAGRPDAGASRTGPHRLDRIVEALVLITRQGRRLTYDGVAVHRDA